MQQLITIETVPISIEYVEKPVKSSDDQSARLRVSRQENTMSIKSSPIPIKMDMFKPENFTLGTDYCYTATAKYSKDGYLKLHVCMKESSRENYQYKKVNRNHENILNYIPGTTQNVSDKLQELQISFNMNHLLNGNTNTSFMPPDLEIKVVEMPKVIIKYVGGPIYIPRSADPNYNPSEDGDQSDFDIKV